MYLHFLRLMVEIDENEFKKCQIASKKYTPEEKWPIIEYIKRDFFARVLSFTTLTVIQLGELAEDMIILFLDNDPIITSSTTPSQIIEYNQIILPQKDTIKKLMGFIPTNCYFLTVVNIDSDFGLIINNSYVMNM